MTAPSCVCEFDGGWPKFTAYWHRRHMAHHVEAFPDVDDVTKANLAMFVDMAERREAVAS